MGQFEILNYIEERPDVWFCAEDLAEEFDNHINSVQRCMKKIARSRFALFKREYDEGSNKKLYIKHKV